MRTTVRHRRALAALSALSALVVLGGCATSGATATDGTAADGDASGSTSTQQESSADVSTDDDATDDDGASTEDPASATSTYVDGTWTADGSYVSPGGTESIEVTLTIADDVVTDVQVSAEAASSTSAQYQSRFADGIAAEVVGVALDDLDVDKVAGSSLTSQGFDEAVAQIQEQARA